MMKDEKRYLKTKRVLSMAERYLERALFFYEKRQYETALGDLSAALQQERHNPELLATRGFILNLLGREAEAEADFDKALKRDPAQWLAYYARAMRAFEAEDYKTALEHLKTALRFAPLRAEIYLYQAAAYYALGDKAAAQKAVDSAEQTLLPDDARHSAVRAWKKAVKALR